MNYICKTIKLFVYLKDMGYDGTREAKYDFIKKYRILFEIHIVNFVLLSINTKKFI